MAGFSRRRTDAVARSGRGRIGTWGLVAGAGVVMLAVTASAGEAGAADCRRRTPFAYFCPTPPPSFPPVTAPPVTAPPVTAPPVTAPPVTAPPVTAPPTTLPRRAPQEVPEAAERLLALANGERALAGLVPLTPRGDVTALALVQSKLMAAAGDIFHSDSYFSAATKALLNSAVRGENVAYNGSVDNAHARLMNSPGHRANLLDPRFSVAGFAVVLAPDGRYFITQDFLQPAGAPRPAAPAAPARSRPAPTPAVAAETTPAPAPPAPPVPAPPLPVAPVAPPTTAVADVAAGLALVAFPVASVRPAVAGGIGAAGAAGAVLLASVATAGWLAARRRRWA